LALGYTVRELLARMYPEEEEDWKRFIMIRGPIGEKRLDENFAWMRQAQTGNKIEECRLKYDYRRYFPKDDIVEEIAERINTDADMAFFESWLGKR